MSPEEAIEIVAQHMLADMACSVDWGDYPKAGEHDWGAVIERLCQLAPYPARYDEAYALLEARAEHDVSKPGEGFQRAARELAAIRQDGDDETEGL